MPAACLCWWRPVSAGGSGRCSAVVQRCVTGLRDDGGMTISQTVRLHEKTVQGAAQTGAPVRSGRTGARVNGVAWAAALRLAGGDPKRIEVVSETVVVVR